MYDHLSPLYLLHRNPHITGRWEMSLFYNVSPARFLGVRPLSHHHNHPIHLSIFRATHWLLWWDGCQWICVLWHPPGIRSDKICWKQTYRDTFSIRPVGWMGWKWTGGRFSWDLPIEESGTLTGQSLHSERIPPCERGLKVQMTFYLLQLYSH